jgi:hypothetical protein
VSIDEEISGTFSQKLSDLGGAVLTCQRCLNAKVNPERAGRTIELFTANCSTEGANEKYPVWDVFQRIPQISVSSSWIWMKLC